MNDDEGEWSVGAGRLVDHLLEDGPIVVEGGRARLAKDLADVPPVALAVRSTLGDLVRKRKVAFGLPRRRNAGVDCGAGHCLVLVAQDCVDLVAKEGAPEGEFCLEGRNWGINSLRVAEPRFGFRAGLRSLRRAIGGVSLRARIPVEAGSKLPSRAGKPSDANSRRLDPEPGREKIEAFRPRRSGSVDICRRRWLTLGHAGEMAELPFDGVPLSSCKCLAVSESGWRSIAITKSQIRWRLKAVLGSF
jgi:hypothetical protein